MTIPTAPPPPTPGFLQFGRQDVSSDLGRSSAFNAAMGDALSRLTPATRNAAVVASAAIAARLVTHDPAKLLILGWSKGGALWRAARDTQSRPGSEELVEIARQRIVASHAPTVDVVVNGSQVAAVRLNLSVVFVIEALSASVRAGRLVALRSGHCDMTATLAVEDVVIATHREQVQLPLVMNLGTGIPLLPNPEGRLRDEHS
jgi:hypothetical protein